MNEHTVTQSGTGFWSAHFSQRTSRRALVWAWLLSCAGFLLLAVMEVKGILWFVLFAYAFAADLALFMATHRVADRPTRTLDERQQAIRNRAYRSAYLILFALVTVAVGGAILAFTTGTQVASQWLAHPEQHPAVLTGFGVIVLQLASLLPTSIIAWNETDTPSEVD